MEGNNLPISKKRRKAEGKVTGKAAQAFNIPSDDNDDYVGYIMGNLVLPPKGIKDSESVGPCAQTFTVCHCQSKAVEVAYGDPDGPDGELDPSRRYRTDWDLADDDSNHNNNSVNNKGAEVPGQVTTASKIGDLMTFPPPASESGFFGSTPASSAPINAATAGERGSKDNAHFLKAGKGTGGPTFGSTGHTPATTSIRFGSAPAPAPNPSFGSAVPFGSTTPAQSSTTFGSIPATAQQPFASGYPIVKKVVVDNNQEEEEESKVA
ncbi:hypothetical protein FRACYDRAFT_232340 [Fragilariopsis cylindrus CCMP1102]|uniref:Uncharacterized protein n=1 Tax=Fragilariopsis cylindrus CCMP1102 TaxID=635003 RepID=A0A1E7FVL8_9STRA|nr:hypothetical protein FRACYDRAFT_232340 [Fragilariopsis cylindrus CCMP1102]|eukprot:OEU22186.1 hypothetical protein FRACYDRAFT_232340 [Fragilariopsis cylindrus CCMP1102]